MNLVTTLHEKRKAKQLKYEKSVLREISIKTLKKRVNQYFGSSQLTSSLMMESGIEEACYDVAIEAYLLGAHFSRFGYYGESVEDVKQRCLAEEKHLIDTLYNFLLYWGNGMEGVYSESLYYLCESYVSSWWMEGFRNGERRHKLRLH